MLYEYQINTKDFLQTAKDSAARQMLFDDITGFAHLHDVEFHLLVEEYEEIVTRAKGSDAVLITIEEMDGIYERKLSITIVNGLMHEIYCVYNEFGEILPFNYGIDCTVVM